MGFEFCFNLFILLLAAPISAEFFYDASPIPTWMNSTGKHFNLNVTSELDDLTLEQVQRPRCGVTDIIEGSGSPFRTVSHYSFFPGTPRWPESKQNLTYAFLPDDQLSDDVKSVFARAFSRWSAVTPLTFTETETFNSTDIRIGFFSGDHGDGKPFDGVLGILAHAFPPPSGLFHLDRDEKWLISGDISTAPSGSLVIDLESVAVHEIGHLLGLGHSSVDEAIMYPTIPRRTRKIELNADDINGIQALYGSNPNGNNYSTPGTPTQERDTSGGAHSLTPWWSLFLIIAVELLLLRHLI